MKNEQKSIWIILGTRPEAIKLAPVIARFQSSNKFNTKVILTGQHREMVDQVMKLFDLKADEDLNIMQSKQSLTDITCRTLKGLDKLLKDLKPALIIVQGDTTTALAAGLAAFYQKIPLAHVEAGLRTDYIYDPYPEEANRRLISQITQLHFAPTELAVQNLKNSDVLGQIHQTGNTVIDALMTVAEKNPSCLVPGLNWSTHRVILVTVHRRENWGEPLQHILEGLIQLLAKFPDIAILLPLHRNPTVREPIQLALGKHPRVFLTEPLDYQELVGAIKSCYLLLTDSGGLQEEAPSLGKPVLVLRETTERPEATIAGTAKLIGTSPNSIILNVSLLLDDKDTYESMSNAINPFGDGQAAERIFNIVEKYLLNQNHET
jgi:UDP-N-acetylglucosamine 2-epimerase (non-hydrolysing)